MEGVGGWIWKRWVPVMEWGVVGTWLAVMGCDDGMG